MKNHSSGNRFVGALKKFFLSAFVVGTFAAYALENHASDGGAVPAANGVTARAARAPAATVPAAPARSSVPAAPAGPPAASAAPSPAAAAGAAPAPASAAPAAPEAAPTATSTPSLATRGGYQDGTYTGSPVDINWGNVQVQATIRSGKIASVQFLEYPNDRRTSVRINSFAVPVLRQEAVQAQSANVDIITGATLTSEGFEMSLQDALSQAQG